jgi:hypothetical protein
MDVFDRFWNLIQFMLAAMKHRDFEAAAHKAIHYVMTAGSGTSNHKRFQ